MENLFLEKSRDFEKEARMYVSEDPNNWVKDILMEFLEKYPMLQEEEMLVEWKKKDTRKGYGVGMIKILGGAVPVVIREFQLHPLDIFVMDNVYLPMTEEVIHLLLNSPDAFESVANPPKGGGSPRLFDPELTDRSFSPTNTGRFGSSGGLSEIRPAKTASVKQASVLDRISVVNKSDVQKVLDAVESDPVVKKAFKSNETYSVIEKLANKPAISAESKQDMLLRNLDVDRQYVYGDDKGNTYVKQANSNIDKSWTVRIPKDEAQDHELIVANEELEKKASAPAESILPVIGADHHISVNERGEWREERNFDEKRANYIDFEEKNPQIGDFGVFLGSNGATEPFTVEKTAKTEKFVKQASHNKVSAVRLVTDPEKMLVFDEQNNWSIVEDDYEKKASINSDLSATDPKLGDFGYFLTKEGATEPFEVRNLQKVANFNYNYISGDCGLEKVAYYIVRKGVKEGVEPHESEKNAYYINKEAKFIKLGGFNDDINRQWKKYKDSLGDISVLGSSGFKTASYELDFESDGTEIEKIAENRYRVPKNAKFIKLGSQTEEKAEISPSQHYVGRDDAGFYYVKGREFNKYASNEHSVRDLDQNEAAWALIHCGATKSDLRKLASIQNNEVRPLAGKIKAPKNVDHVMEAVKEAYEKSSGELSKVSKLLVKEASELSDKASVDAVLSLGLVNKNNIVEFIEAIPIYEQVMSSLAKLLLTARLGLAVPSDEVKRAMDAVTNTMLILRKIKATLQPVK